MRDPLLSIDEAVKATPWSRSQLYRIANEEESPFRKVKGRWVVIESELHQWVRSFSSETPPGRKPKPQGLMAEVEELQRDLAG